MKRIFTSCLLTGFVALGAPASAGPEGVKVVHGDVKIEQMGDTTIIHASDKSIIKLKSMDIAPHETLQFVQPDAKSSVLGKINGAKPTKIEGALLANGRVYLVNKAGVYFAPGAEIRVAEIVAAAGNISNRDFLKGVDRFTDVEGAVRNDGSIHAQAAKLIGATVANTGFISAEDAIVMVSGNDVLLGKRGSRLYVKIGTTTPGEAGTPGVEQSGALEAEGGQVLLAGGDSLGMAIEHSGTTRARDIEIAGSDRGIVEVSGTLDASDRAEGGTGGHIEVTGERIALRSAELDASGDAGGGEVLVGGDFHGEGDVRTSDITFADPDTRIRADAVSEGDGGKVVLWADYTTGFHGDIDARGGAEGGDGGVVEVSGKEYLFFHGDVDTTAAQGERGLLLLDPANITIANGTGDGDADGTSTFKGDPSGVTGSVLFADTAPTTIFESELEGLGASTNVVLQATNSLVMQDLADNVLGLPTTGSVALTGTGSFSMDPSDTIRTEGATINITGGTVTLGNLSTRGATGTLTGGGVSIAVTGTSSTTIRDINAGAGAVTILAGGSVLDDGNTATRITASGLVIGASGANASIGSLASPLGTNITATATPNSGAISLAAAAGTSGGIFVSEASSMLLNNINGGTGKTVSLTSELGNITSQANTLISGSTLTLTANDTNAAIGASGAPLRLNIAGPVNASKVNGNGGIFLTAVTTGAGPTLTANPLIVGSIDAGAGNVNLTAATGAAPVTGLQGSILDDGNASTRITGNQLSMTAAQSGATIGTAALPIQTNLTAALSASAPNGSGGGSGIFVSESNGLVVGSVNAGTLKNVSLTAEAGSITDDANAATTIAGAMLNLNAQSAGAGIGTGAAPMRVTLSNQLNASAINGATGIFINETGSATDPMLVGTIDAGNGSVRLVAENGAIVDDGNNSTFIGGNGLTLTATASSGTNGVNTGSIGTQTIPIDVHDIGSLTATATGAIFVTQTQGGDVTLGPITSNGRTGTQGAGAVTGVPGGVTISTNDGAALLVNAPITTYAGALTPSGNQLYTLPGSITLDSPEAIEFGVASLTSGGSINLNTHVPGIDQPVLASIFRRPGTSGDAAADQRNLTLTASNGSITVGEGQVISVPGDLAFAAPEGLTPPPGGTLVPGTVTVGDVNAMNITVVDAQRGVVLQRSPRQLFQQDGSVVGDGGVDWVANTITVNVSGGGGSSGMTSTGSGPPPTFSTADGLPVTGAPGGTRFGTPFVTTPLTPASFVLAPGAGTPGGRPAPGAVLDLRGTGSNVAGTPDAVAPVPYPIARDDGQLEKLNADTGLHPVWGMDLLAFLRCSKAPGDDPDAVSIDCLGYDVQQQSRAPLSGPEAASARTDYRRLMAVRDELRTDLQKAFDAYRAQTPDAEPSGADFRRFVQENPEYGDAANALDSLRGLLDTLDGMLGPEQRPFETWQQDLLRDFTPGNMTPEQLYEATGSSTGRVRTADRAATAEGPES